MGEDRSGRIATRPRNPLRSGIAFLLAGVMVIALGFTFRVSREKAAEAAERRDRLDLRGAVLSPALPKPDFTLTDTDLQPFSFREETEGALTLLFFGYTYCPDVCPVHFANLAAVLRDLAPEARRQTKVVFVTVDPERDTTERMREWLDAFDTRFIGLRGSLEEANAILASMRLPPAIHDDPGPNGNYTVGHPGQILAFTPDGLLRVFYPFGTRQTDWAHDLPRLLAFRPGETDEPGIDGVSPAAANAYVTAPIGDRPVSLYVTIDNQSDRGDAIVAASTARAESVELHRQTMDDGRMMMEPVDEIPVSAREITSLAPGGYHLMLHELVGPLAVGDTLTVQLRFRAGRTLDVGAVVVDYADLEDALQAAVPVQYGN